MKPKTHRSKSGTKLYTLISGCDNGKSLFKDIQVYVREHKKKLKKVK